MELERPDPYFAHSHLRFLWRMCDVFVACSFFFQIPIFEAEKTLFSRKKSVKCPYAQKA
jgi:hypothetical protein